jgi:SAM-dependent methyltransferase
MLEVRIMTTSAEISLSSEALFASSTFDWEKYDRFRPPYLKEFYNLIFDYHRAHEGNWDIAHDVGTGGGKVAEELGRYFTSIIASDPDMHHIRTAKARLLGPSSEAPVTKYRFVEGCAEEMTKWILPGTVDMITIGEAIHRTDHAVVIQAATKTLKPGGTLAVWLYGPRPSLPDIPGATHILHKIFERLMEQLPKNPRVSRACAVSDGEYDSIDLGSRGLSHVKRLKWHSHNSQFFWCREYESAVGKSDELETRDGKDQLWVTYGDTAWIRGYFDYLYPDLPWDEEREHLYVDLEQLLKGKKGRIVWPAVLLLASRKRFNGGLIS